MINRHATSRHAEIAQILMLYWDPISVRNEPDAEDEYDGYIQGIDALIRSGSSPVSIADHLTQIVVAEMGLPPDRQRALAAAKKLAALNSRR